MPKAIRNKAPWMAPSLNDLTTALQKRYDYLQVHSLKCLVKPLHKIAHELGIKKHKLVRCWLAAYDKQANTFDPTALERINWVRGRPMRLGCTQEEIDHICHPDTLQAQAGMSIAERAGAISLRGPLLKPHQLRLIYYANRISLQKVQCPIGNPRYIPDAEQEAALLLIKEEIQGLRNDGYVVFQADESIFSERGFQQKTWARMRNPPARSRQGFGFNYIAVLIAISEETGMGTWHEKERAFTGLDFCDFLRDLRREHQDIELLALFLDNCSIHKTEQVRAEAQRQRIRLCYNAPYRP
jgi:hypothetical protein